MKRLYSLIHTLAKNMTAVIWVTLTHMTAYSRMSFKTCLVITLPLIGTTGYYHSLGKSLAYLIPCLRLSNENKSIGRDNGEAEVNKDD